MRSLLLVGLSFALAACYSASTPPSTDTDGPDPTVHSYREVDGQTLRAYVFIPAMRGAGEPASAVLLFHGGGWSDGTPEWTFDPDPEAVADGVVQHLRFLRELGFIAAE